MSGYQNPPPDASGWGGASYNHRPTHGAPQVPMDAALGVVQGNPTTIPMWPQQQQQYHNVGSSQGEIHQSMPQPGIMPMTTDLQQVDPLKSEMIIQHQTPHRGLPQTTQTIWGPNKPPLARQAEQYTVLADQTSSYPPLPGTQRLVNRPDILIPPQQGMATIKSLLPQTTKTELVQPASSDDWLRGRVGTSLGIMAGLENLSLLGGARAVQRTLSGDRRSGMCSPEVSMDTTCPKIEEAWGGIAGEAFKYSRTDVGVTMVETKKCVGWELIQTQGGIPASEAAPPELVANLHTPTKTHVIDPLSVAVSKCNMYHTIGYRVSGIYASLSKLKRSPFVVVPDRNGRSAYTLYQNSIDRSPTIRFSRMEAVQPEQQEEVITNIPALMFNTHVDPTNSGDSVQVVSVLQHRLIRTAPGTFILTKQDIEAKFSSSCTLLTDTKNGPQTIESSDEVPSTIVIYGHCDRPTMLTDMLTMLDLTMAVFGDNAMLCISAVTAEQLSDRLERGSSAAKESSPVTMSPLKPGAQGQHTTTTARQLNF